MNVLPQHVIKPSTRFLTCIGLSAKILYIFIIKEPALRFREPSPTQWTLTKSWVKSWPELAVVKHKQQTICTCEPHTPRCRYVLCTCSWDKTRMKWQGINHKSAVHTVCPCHSSHYSGLLTLPRCMQSIGTDHSGRVSPSLPTNLEDTLTETTGDVLQHTTAEVKCIRWRPSIPHNIPTHATGIANAFLPPCWHGEQWGQREPTVSLSCINLLMF